MLDAALNGVIGFWSAINKGLGAGERVFELIDRKPQIDPLAGKALSPTRTGSLELKDVSFAYPSRPEAPILQKLNLTIARGESVAIWCVTAELCLLLTAVVADPTLTWRRASELRLQWRLRFGQIFRPEPDPPLL